MTNGAGPRSGHRSRKQRRALGSASSCSLVGGYLAFRVLNPIIAASIVILAATVLGMAAAGARLEPAPRLRGARTGPRRTPQDQVREEPGRPRQGPGQVGGPPGPARQGQLRRPEEQHAGPAGRPPDRLTPPRASSAARSAGPLRMRRTPRPAPAAVPSARTRQASARPERPATRRRRRRLCPSLEPGHQATAAPADRRPSCTTTSPVSSGTPSRAAASPAPGTDGPRPAAGRPLRALLRAPVHSPAARRAGRPRPPAHPRRGRRAVEQWLQPGRVQDDGVVGDPVRRHPHARGRRRTSIPVERDGQARVDGAAARPGGTVRARIAEPVEQVDAAVDVGQDVVDRRGRPEQVQHPRLAVRRFVQPLQLACSPELAAGRDAGRRAPGGCAATSAGSRARARSAEDDVGPRLGRCGGEQRQRPWPVDHRFQVPDGGQRRPVGHRRRRPAAGRRRASAHSPALSTSRSSGSVAAHQREGGQDADGAQRGGLGIAAVAASSMPSAPSASTAGQRRARQHQLAGRRPAAVGVRQCQLGQPRQLPAPPAPRRRPGPAPRRRAPPAAGRPGRRRRRPSTPRPPRAPPGRRAPRRPWPVGRPAVRAAGARPAIRPPPGRPAAARAGRAGPPAAPASGSSTPAGAVGESARRPAGPEGRPAPRGRRPPERRTAPPTIPAAAAPRAPPPPPRPARPAGPRGRRSARCARAARPARPAAARAATPAARPPARRSASSRTPARPGDLPLVGGAAGHGQPRASRSRSSTAAPSAASSAAPASPMRGTSPSSAGSAGSAAPGRRGRGPASTSDVGDRAGRDVPAVGARAGTVRSAAAAARAARRSGWARARPARRPAAPDGRRRPAAPPR